MQEVFILLEISTLGALLFLTSCIAAGALWCGCKLGTILSFYAISFVMYSSAAVVLGVCIGSIFLPIRHIFVACAMFSYLAVMSSIIYKSRSDAGHRREVSTSWSMLVELPCARKAA